MTGSKDPFEEWVMCLYDFEFQVGLGFCSLSCLRKWAGFLKWDLREFEPRWTSEPNCIHCYMCGTLTRDSPECRLHDGNCPEKVFEMTYVAHRIGRFVSRAVQRPLEDSDIELMRQVLRDRENGDGADVLTARIVDRIRKNTRTDST